MVPPLDNKYYILSEQGVTNLVYHYKPSEPDERPSKPDEKPSEPDERPSEPDEKPSEPDEQPSKPALPQVNEPGWITGIY